MFNNYAKIETSINKIVRNKMSAKDFGFKLFRDDLLTVQSKLSEYEQKATQFPDNSSFIFTFVAQLKEKLQRVAETSKSYSDILDSIGEINVNVDCSNEQLEKLLSFKNDKYSEILAQKLQENSDIDSRGQDDQITNDLFHVLDAVVNDDTNDKINSKYEGNFDSSPIQVKQPIRLFESQYNFNGNQHDQTRQSMQTLTPRTDMHSLRKESIRSGQINMRESQLTDRDKRESIRDLKDNRNKIIEELDFHNFKNIYEERTIGRESLQNLHLLSDRGGKFKMDTNSSHTKTDDRNLYIAKTNTKGKNVALYGSNIVRQTNEFVNDVPHQNTNHKKTVLKNSPIVMSGKNCVISGNIIDEIKLKDILSSLKTTPGTLKQVEFNENTFKCNLAPTLKLICQESLPFLLKIDMKKNKCLAIQTASKKDKAELSVVNILLIL